MSDKGFVLLPEFLPQQAWLAIIGYLCAREQDFTPSLMYGPLLPPRIDEEERRSVGLADLGPFKSPLELRLREVWPRVSAELGVEAFEPKSIEMGATVYKHEGFFGLHHDGGEHRRPISFIYYCHREPKAFTGGELRIEHPRGTELKITPQANTAVFLLADWMHEVLPVQVPSRAFRDARLTIQGWAHRNVPIR